MDFCALSLYFAMWLNLLVPTRQIFRTQDHVICDKETVTFRPGFLFIFIFLARSPRLEPPVPSRREVVSGDILVLLLISQGRLPVLPLPSVMAGGGHRCPVLA